MLSSTLSRPISHVSDGLAFFILLAASLLAWGLFSSTRAQTVKVQNGATLEVQNGAAFDLEGGAMDFGDADETARLRETSGGRVTGGTLTATRKLDAPSEANPAGLGATISADQNLGTVDFTRGHVVQSADGNESIERYYDVAPTNNSSLDATLTFTYDDAELNGLEESTLELFRSTNEGANWSREGQDARDEAANEVTLNGIGAFSRWTLGSEDSPLPVELVRFEARADGEETVHLVWETAGETDNAGFEVERRVVGAGDWREVGFVEGAGTTAEAQHYRFEDAELPYEADRALYRLRQVDWSGASEHSEEVEVELAAPGRLALHAPYPNPSADRATVRYELPEATEVRLEVYNALGQRVATLVEGREEAGRKAAQIDVGSLASGTYFVRLTADGTMRTEQMIVVQ